MDTIIPKKRFRPQTVILGVAAVAAAFFGYRAFTANSQGTRLNVQTDRLQLDTVDVQEFQEFIPVTGIVLPIKTVFVGAVEGGRIEEKFVEDGALIKKGQPILRLSNPDLQLAYLNQEGTIVSQINQARNTSLFREQQSLNLRETRLDIVYRMNLAATRLKRNEELLANGVVSKVEVEELREEHENLRQRLKLLHKTIEKDSMSTEFEKSQMGSTLDLMRRNLEISKQSLDNLIVKSPIDGQLSGLSAELGELVNEGAQIAQMDDLTAFKIRVAIDEFYISRIFTGQEGNFSFDNKNYTLVISKIYPQVSNGRFEADMLFKGDAPNIIKRGQSVTVKLELSAQEDAMVLKRGGFYSSTGGNWVYVLNKDGKTAIKQDLNIGRQSPVYYEILSGLKAGDVVIISSYENYGDKDILVLQ
ncbi:MAG: HlyD family efflux transporter periplasmic adaptor subunit [Saprospiraceae bacterium]|nr:HlyD family efflux transporter periplasmic adaptor subunit [Saprospiraceae bacterium]